MDRLLLRPHEVLAFAFSVVFFGICFSLPPRDSNWPRLSDASVAVDRLTHSGQRLAQGERLLVNRASVEELRLLPGIGAALARRIVDYRRDYGALGGERDLVGVAGIGPKKARNLLPYLDFSK